MTSVSHFRGHLFADLRGSTAFTQRAGNAAGAELVTRFRQMVRDEVGSHSGAEVKTEGDAIYVVFPSASTAVMCGLALVENAEIASREHPEVPIHIGVGIHAGEAIEVAEGGYIGTAVNLAARVCAVAEAGEVLVTGTVREVSQGSVPVTFVPRGKRRFKGINEQVDLWRVVAEGTLVHAQSRVDRRLLVPLIGALGIAAALILAVALWPGATPGPTPTPVAAVPTSQPLRIGPLPIGEYVSGAFTPAFTMAVTDPGWAMTSERASSAEFLHEPSPPGRLAVARLSGVHSEPCNPDGSYPTEVGTTPEDLMDALGAVWFLEMSDPAPIQIDRRPGLGVDFRISDGVFAACDLSGPVPLFPLGSDTFGAAPGDWVRLDAVDVGGQTVSFIALTDNGVDRPVTELEAFRALADNLVDSVRFAE